MAMTARHLKAERERARCAAAGLDAVCNLASPVKERRGVSTVAGRMVPIVFMPLVAKYEVLA